MKTTQILKAIAFGVLAGAAIFFVHIPFPFFLAVIFIFFAFRFLGGRRRWGWHHGYYEGYNFWHNPENACKWHSMTPDQRKAFTEKMERELFADTTTETK